MKIQILQEKFSSALSLPSLCLAVAMVCSACTTATTTTNAATNTAAATAATADKVAATDTASPAQGLPQDIPQDLPQSFPLDEPSAVWRNAIAEAEAWLYARPYSRSSPATMAKTEDFLAGLINSAWKNAAQNSHPHSVGLVRSWYIIGAPGLINPDNQYFWTVLDPEASYVLEGVRGTHTQLFLQVLSGNPSMEMGKGLQIFNDQNLDLQPGDPIRIYIGGKQRPDAWFPLHPEARNLLVRQTFSDWDETPSMLNLTRIDGTIPSQTRAATGHFALAADYLKRSTKLWADVFVQRSMGRPINQIEPPRHISEALQSQQGIGFHYRISPQEALVVTVRQSPAAYQAIQISNPWFVAPDFVHRHSSLNQAQAHRDPDGNFRFIIALQDPGLQNWLDPDGEADGAAYMRWQGIERALTPEEYPRLDLVPLAELKERLRRAGSTMGRVATPRPPRYNAPALK